MIPLLFLVALQFPAGDSWWLQHGLACVGRAGVATCHEMTPEFVAANQPALSPGWLATTRPVLSNADPYIIVWDLNLDERLDISDVIHLVGEVLRLGPCRNSNPEKGTTCWDDVNGDSVVDIADVVLETRAVLEAP